MLNTLNTSIKMLEWYIGESWQYGLFLLALLYLLISKEEKEKKRLFVAYTGIFLVLYFCPITARIIMDYCVGELVYWRMIWLLPIPMILAYTATRIWQRQKGRLRGGILLAVMVLLVILSGRCVYGEQGPYQRAGNLLKLPPEVCWISDIIVENAENEEELNVVAPAELVCFVRQYNPKIKLAYGRNQSRTKRRRKLAEEMLAPSPDFKKIVRNARKLGCKFLIYPANEWQDETIQLLEYEPVGNVNTYIIYKDKKIG